MKVLVLSDSHGAVHFLRRILDTEPEAEIVFFLGDGLSDIEKVKLALTEQGYYLQLPPPPEDLLKQHLSVMGQKTDDTNK